MDRAGTAFLREAAGVIRSAPVRVEGGPEKMHAVYFVNADRSRLTVALVNDFSWVFTGRRTRNGRPIPGIKEKLDRQPPPPCRSVRILLQTNQPIRSVHELATGRSLLPHRTAAGYSIDVPPCDCIAAVHIEL